MMAWSDPGPGAEVVKGQEGDFLYEKEALK